MVGLLRRVFSTRPELVRGKVSVIGADSPVGRRLTLLLKMSPHVRHLVCCPSASHWRAHDAQRGGSRDAACTSAQSSATAARQHGSDQSSPLQDLVTDLSCIDTTTEIHCCTAPMPHTGAALRGSQLVFVCPGYNFVLDCSDRDVALGIIAGEVESIAAGIAAHARGAVVGIVSEPVNALVPLFAEHLKRAGAFDPRKLLGLMTWDVHDARCRVAEVLRMNPFDINISVLGGHGGARACPLIHQSGLALPYGSVEDITAGIQSNTRRLRAVVDAMNTPSAHDVDAEKTPISTDGSCGRASSTSCGRDKHSEASITSTPTSSATMSSLSVPHASSDECDGVSVRPEAHNDEGRSSASCIDEQTTVYSSVSYACYEFGMSVLKAMRGDFGITECAFIESTARVETPYFGSRVVLGAEGVERILHHGPLSHFEHEIVERAVPEIVKDVEAGVQLLRCRDSRASTE